MRVLLIACCTMAAFAVGCVKSDTDAPVAHEPAADEPSAPGADLSEWPVRGKLRGRPFTPAAVELHPYEHWSDGHQGYHLLLHATPGQRCKRTSMVGEGFAVGFGHTPELEKHRFERKVTTVHKSRAPFCAARFFDSDEDREKKVVTLDGSGRCVLVVDSVDLDAGRVTGRLGFRRKGDAQTAIEGTFDAVVCPGW